MERSNRRRGPNRLARKIGVVVIGLALLAGTGVEPTAAAPVAGGAPASVAAPASFAAPADRLAQVRRCRPTRLRRCPSIRRNAPVRGGTLVVALTADPGLLNPAITTSGAVHPAAEPMFNGLVSIGEDSKPVGELAQSWRIENGGARYTFTLRPNIRWHDGQLFTSADVKYTYEQVLLKFHARTRASMAAALDGIDTPSPRTVVFRFKRPYAPLLQQMDVTEGPILPRHIYEGTDPNTNPFNLKPVGTGPFKFVSYQTGSQITLERNPAYFKRGLPYLDKMVLRVIPDANTRIAALESGEIDWLPGVPVPAADRARLNSRISLTRTAWNPGGANCIMTMSYNLDRPHLQDVRVRRAIAHAIDRDQFLSQVLFGEGRVADAPISSGIPFAHATDVHVPGFSLALSGQLLDTAGWQRENDVRVARGIAGIPDGTRLALTFVLRPTDAKYGEIIRQRLAAVGIPVTLRTLEDVVFRPTIFRDRNFDLNVISYCNATDPQVGVRRMYHSNQIGPTDFTNSSGYRNAEVDALWDQAAEAVDRNEARRVYTRLQEILVNDMPYLWLVETLATRAHPAACTGFKYNSGLFAEAAFCRR